MDGFRRSIRLVFTKYRPLLALITGMGVSMVGNSLTAVAVPWYVLSTTGSAAETGLAGAFAVLPTVLGGVLGGGLVDRLGHRRACILSDVLSAIAVAAIPALHATVGLAYWELLALVFLRGLVTTPGVAARQTLVGELAEAAGLRREAVNSSYQVVFRSSFLIGPVLAGLLIVWLGPAPVLWFDALTFAFSAGIVALGIPATLLSVTTGTGAGGLRAYLAHIGRGSAHLFRDPVLTTIIVSLTLVIFVDSPMTAVLVPVYARTIFHGSAYLGAMLGAAGAGGMVGVMGYGVLSRWAPRRHTLIATFVLLGGCRVALALTPPLPLTLAVMFVSGMAAGPINPLVATIFQERVPVQLRGQVFGVVRAVTFGIAPVGVYAVGLGLEYTSVRNVLLVIGVAYLGLAVWLLFNRALSAMGKSPERQPTSEPARP